MNKLDGWSGRGLSGGGLEFQHLPPIILWLEWQKSVTATAVTPAFLKIFPVLTLCATSLNYQLFGCDLPLVTLGSSENSTIIHTHIVHLVFCFPTVPFCFGWVPLHLHQYRLVATFQHQWQHVRASLFPTSKGCRPQSPLIYSSLL